MHLDQFRAQLDAKYRNTCADNLSLGLTKGTLF